MSGGLQHFPALGWDDRTHCKKCLLRELKCLRTCLWYRAGCKSYNEQVGSPFDAFERFFKRLASDQIQYHIHTPGGSFLPTDLSLSQILRLNGDSRSYTEEVPAMPMLHPQAGTTDPNQPRCA